MSTTHAADAGSGPSEASWDEGEYVERDYIRPYVSLLHERGYRVYVCPRPMNMTLMNMAKVGTRDKGGIGYQKTQKSGCLVCCLLSGARLIVPLIFLLRNQVLLLFNLDLAVTMLLTFMQKNTHIDFGSSQTLHEDRRLSESAKTHSASREKISTVFGA